MMRRGQQPESAFPPGVAAQEGGWRADPRFGPVPLWWWSAERLSLPRLRHQLRMLADAGIRNLCVIDLAPVAPTAGCAPDDPAFASEEWWEIFGGVLDEAEAVGSRIWFYDQLGFSSANIQARLVTAEPSFAGRRLVELAEGDEPPGGAEEVARAGGRLYVSVREGFDWLSPDACAALMAKVHGELERRFPDRLGEVLAGTFQDELPAMPTWSPILAARYAARHGEPLEASLPLMFAPKGAERPSAEAAAVRRRVWGILGELAEESFFAPLGAWHERHGMLVGCDQAGPGRQGDPHGAQRLYLDYVRTHRHLSAPGSDPDGEAKIHSSIAHLHGGNRVWLEGFHSSGWGSTIEETLHWLTPWLQAGVTLFDPHAVYYSTRGGWWEWAPPDTGWRQPYAAHYPIFADAVARVCEALGAGHHVCDVAVLYPAAEIWEHMTLADAAAGEHAHSVAGRDPDARVAAVRAAYWGVCGRQDRHDPLVGALRADRRDFDVIDEDALGRASSGGGVIAAAGGERYRALVLPASLPRSPEARRVMGGFAAAGGLVVLVGATPDAGDLPEGALRVPGPEALPDALAPLGRDVDGPGLALHRRSGDDDVYLLLPPLETLMRMHEPSAGPPPLPESGRFRLRAAAPPETVELWDPVRGEHRSLAFVAAPDGSWVDIDAPFADWPAALVVCHAGKVWTGGADRGGAGVAVRTRPAGGAATRPGGPAALPPPGGLDGGATLEDGWFARVAPTLDNSWGDFDLIDRGPLLRPQCRRFGVRVERRPGQGLEEGWASGGGEGWESRLWGEAALFNVSRPSSPGAPLDAAEAQTVVPHGARPSPGAAPLTSAMAGSFSMRSWAGRMGRVPREFIDFGSCSAGDEVTVRTHAAVPEAGLWWLAAEGGGDKTAAVDGSEVSWERSGHASLAQVALGAGMAEISVTVRLGADGRASLGVALTRERPEAQPRWLAEPDHGPRVLTASLRLPCAPSEAKAHFAVRGRGELRVNGERVSVLGGFNPYRTDGEDAVVLTGALRQGDNEISVRFSGDEEASVLLDLVARAEGRLYALCSDASWSEGSGGRARELPGATDAHWVRPRPHLLGGVGWITPDEVPPSPPLVFTRPDDAGAAVWLRAPLPLGAAGCEVPLAMGCRARAWVGGEEVALREGRAVFPPQAAGSPLVLRVEPDGALCEAAVLVGPVPVVTSAAPRSAELGDWRDALGLTSFSGAVDYERLVDVAPAALDLGWVRGTAEVWVDGEPWGARCWSPYRFARPASSPRPGPGPHRLRIRVTNTLGAHYGEGRPTYFEHPDQGAGGLFGPVRAWPAAEAAGGRP